MAVFCLGNLLILRGRNIDFGANGDFKGIWLFQQKHSAGAT
jgi:hypothetical protein